MAGLNPYRFHTFFCIFFVLFLFACGWNGERVSFPKNEAEFQPAFSSPLRFSKPLKLNWAEAPIDSSLLPRPKKIDFSKFPARHAELSEFKKLYRPMQEKKLDWEKIPDTSFELSVLPVTALSFRVYQLARPKMVKINLPQLKEDAFHGMPQFSLTQGLPSVSTSLSLIDSKGIVWICTSKGICRYSGETLEIYGAEQGLEDENITAANEDSNGQIWIGTTRGLIYILDISHGILKRLILDQNIKRNLQAYTIYSFIEDNNGLIWIGSFGGGVYIVDPVDKTVRNMTRSQGLITNTVAGIFKEKNGTIWICSIFGGMNVINKETHSLKRITRAQGLNDNSVLTSLQDNQGNIWLGTDSGGIDIIDANKEKIRYLTSAEGLAYNPKNGTDISALTLDSAGMFWIGMDSGMVNIYDPKTQSIKLLRPGLKIKNDFCTGFIINKQGLLWVSLTQDGIYQIDTKGIWANHIIRTQGLEQNNIGSLLESPQGLIFAGTYHGVAILDPKTEIINRLSKINGLSNNVVYAMTMDAQERLWIGTLGGGIDIVNLHDWTIRNLNHLHGLKNDNILSVLQDSRGRIWLGTYDEGIELIDFKRKILLTISSESGLGSNEVTKIIEDSTGRIWVATLGGLHVIEADLKSMRQLTRANGLQSNTIETLMVDDNARIWVGSNKGIDIIDEKEGSIRSLTRDQGLSGTSVNSMINRNGRIYAGTNNGLSVINTRSDGGIELSRKADGVPWTIRNYGKAQGLSNLHFNSNAVLGTRNGQIWWGIEQMLTEIEEPEDDTTVMPTYVSGIDVNDISQYFIDRRRLKIQLADSDSLWTPDNDHHYAKNNIPEDTGFLQRNAFRWDSVAGPFNMPVSLKFPYQKTGVRFHFSDLHMGNYDKTKYRYMLEGADKQWSALTYDPYSSNYYGLSPGHYRFIVSGSSMNGRWSQPAELDFEVEPRWWQTIWAWILYFLAIVAAISGVIQFRVRNLRRENLRLEDKIMHRTDELRKSLLELKSTQAQLIQSEKMASLGELTAGIAHEIQNPLNFVNNFSEVNGELIDEMEKEFTEGRNEEGFALSADIKKNLEKISEHGKRADAIVKGMLQHSRIHSGQYEPTDINALADEYLRLSFHAIREKDNHFQCEIKTDLDGRIGKINIVPQHIGMVFINIYNNAFYSLLEKQRRSTAPETGNEDYKPILKLATKMITNVSEAWKIEIRIYDNGQGMSAKIMDKVFQPFFTTKPTGQGTGLGLSLAYDIITKEHGGIIEAVSKEGEYAEFIIRLPLS